MQSPLTPSGAGRSAVLADPALRSALRGFIGKRVDASDVDDVLQATLADALAAPGAPVGAEQIRKWVYGIARHKVADLYRERRREAPLEPDEDVPVEGAPISARDLLRWAEKELPEGDRQQGTLDVLLEEADGGKLEHIAAERKLPAERMRQRVARLRRHFRARWAAQLAAAIGAAVVTVGAGLYLWKPKSPPAVVLVPEPRVPHPELERAAELRRTALERCREHSYRECLDGLDAARALDPVGDAAEAVVGARAAATQALEPKPAPSAAPSAGPDYMLAPPDLRKTAPVPTSPSPSSNPPAKSKAAPKKAKPLPSKVGSFQGSF